MFHTNQDDFWSASGGWPDARPNVSQDIGLTDQQRAHITDAYNANMDALRNATLAAGKFSWQVLWTGGNANSKGGTVPHPIVSQSNCASQLRSLCNATSPAQTRAMMFAFGGEHGNPSDLPDFEQDLANFLLVRG